MSVSPSLALWTPCLSVYTLAPWTLCLFVYPPGAEWQEHGSYSLNGRGERDDVSGLPQQRHVNHASLESEGSLENISSPEEALHRSLRLRL